jgi:two-component system chemotaxis response regulator CheB
MTTRVLVVDDSPSVRELLAYILGSDAEIEIVGCAADGEEALRMAQEKKPDVITMDLHMPNVNGLEATRRIMQICPTPIVIVSGSDDRAEVGASFSAIEAGALVVMQRPFGPGNAAHHETSNALIRMVKSMAEVKVVRRWPKDARRTKGRMVEAADQPRRPSPKLVVLGASTGGPAVLREILAELPPDYSLPIVIVQHMSSGFVTGFAEWLSTTSGIAVGIAKHGASLVGGRAYLAPDGFQMGVTSDLHIRLARDGPEYGMCPSVSYLFRSIHKDLCRSTAAVLLTGMGKDGARELRQLKENGAITIVQDRATSAVYGMPGEAIKQDAARLILDPTEIGKTLRAFGQDVSLGFPFRRI